MLLVPPDKPARPSTSSVTGESGDLGFQLSSGIRSLPDCGLGRCGLA